MFRILVLLYPSIVAWACARSSSLSACGGGTNAVALPGFCADDDGPRASSRTAFECSRASSAFAKTWLGRSIPLAASVNACSARSGRWARIRLRIVSKLTASERVESTAARVVDSSRCSSVCRRIGTAPSTLRRWSVTTLPVACSASSTLRSSLVPLIVPPPCLLFP